MLVYLDNCCYNRPFDYTKWSKNLYSDLPLRELNSKAAEFVKNNYEKPINVKKLSLR
jgi:hypothetical protein